MLAFWTGILGSVVLVLGSAWPDAPEGTKPYQNRKNQFFALGGLLMLLYAWLNWLQGGNVFFILLEIMVVLASILMLLGVSEKRSTLVISLLGLAFIAWSLLLFKEFQAVFFILGLAFISLGYISQSGSKRRQAALLLGSVLVAYFSFLAGEWIFFGLNLVFAAFSAYYLVSAFKKRV